MAGYSGTPLSKKLGIKSGFRLYIKNAPENYMRLIEPIPADVKVLTRLSDNLDLIHFFAKSKKELSSNIETLLSRLSLSGVIWVSWPKKASRVSTDLTVGVVRDVVFGFGLVDIKVCAVDATWSGLKLVKRKRKIKLGQKRA